MKQSLYSKQKIVLTVSNDTLTDVRVRKIASALQDRGFDILIAGKKSDSKITPNDAIPYKQLPMFFRSGFLFYAMLNIRLFLFLVFRKEINIIWSNDLDTLPACSLAAFIRRKPLVYDSHELFTEVPELQGRIFKQKIWTLAEKIFIKRVDKMITVCESIANYYDNKYQNKPVVIRNMPKKVNAKIKCSRNELGLPDNKKIVIYQGAINVGRGIEELIEAAKLLPEVFFVIAGAGDLYRQIKQNVQALPYSDRILLTGRLPYHELLKYTHSSDLGVSLEKNMGLNYYYALPNKLFDYIQAQIPVLVSNLPEMSKITEIYKIGELIQTHKPSEIAKKIQSILDKDKSFYEQALKKAAEELNWEKESKQLDSILSGLFMPKQA